MFASASLLSWRREDLGGGPLVLGVVVVYVWQHCWVLSDCGGVDAKRGVFLVGEGDGSRMREDTEGGREYPAARFLGGLGMTFGVRWGNGRFANRPYGEREGRGERGGGWDGSPHARGHGEGREYPAARFLRDSE